jgi:tetratricopeptide (TPR) repeat protein
MQYFLVFLLISISLAVIARGLTVLIHEFGHAIPALLLTKKPVTIYIGSYGDKRKSLRINLGTLVIFFRYNPLLWKLGLCVPSATSVSLTKQIIYTLFGPVASLLIGVISFYLVFAFDGHSFLKLFLIVFVASALFDTLISLIPNSTPIMVYNGLNIYNDGYQLKLLFHYKKLPQEYEKASHLYNQQRYTEAAILFGRMISNGINDENIYRLAIHSYLQERNYSKVMEFSNSFAATNKLNSDDLSTMALAYSQLGLYSESMSFYDQSLQLNPENKYSLNNKGYTLMLQNSYEDAIPFFNRVIELDIDFTSAYDNRGLSKIKLGNIEEGLNDINHALKLDPNNAYCYRSMGIYHFDKQEYYQALQLFEKAKGIDSTTHKIDELINNTKKQLTEIRATKA